MTLTLVWTFAILTFISGQGASCGIASSPPYIDDASCEAARSAYEAQMMRTQTPSRRVSTLRCEERVTRP